MIPADNDEGITYPLDKNNPFHLKLAMAERAPADLAVQTPARLRMILIRSGAAEIDLNGKPFLVSAPGLICLNERDRIIVKGDQLLKICLFHPDLINGSFSLDNIRNDPRSFEGTAIHDCYLFAPFLETDPVRKILDPDRPLFDQILSLLREVTETLLSQSDPFWLCRGRSQFLQILGLVQRAASSGPAGDAIPVGVNDPLIREVLLHLHGLLDTRITVEELARTFATNRTTLSSRFKKATGETLIGYLQQIRLQAAARLLRNTDLCPVYIQELTGFRDSSWFHRAFRTRFGIPPGAYREKMRISG